MGEQQMESGVVDPEASVDELRSLLESVIFEDGLAAAVEVATTTDSFPDVDPVTRYLLIVELLTAAAYDRLQTADPFDPAEADLYSEPGEAADDEGELDPHARAVRARRRFERVTRHAHLAMNQAGAARAIGAARFAAFDNPAGVPDHLPGMLTEREPGHANEFADSFLGPTLGLGPYEAARLVEESMLARTRTPKLLDEVAHGSSASGRDVTNLATVSAIARELRDARPDTCERVEDTVLHKSVHRRTKVEAARAARGLVARFEASAARSTAKRTAAQQQGVWLDPHPTPGLTQFSAVLGSERADALMRAVDVRADELHRTADDGRTLGQHRTDALFDLAMSDVELIAHVDLLVAVPAGDVAAELGDRGGADGRSADGVRPISEPEVSARDVAQPAVALGHGSSGATATQRTSPDTRPVARHLGPAEISALLNRGDLLAYVAGGEAIDLASVLGMVWNLAKDRDRRSMGTAGGDPPRGRRQRRGHEARVTATTHLIDAETGIPVEDPGESSAYRPPPVLRRRVIARDRTCRHPGCTRPARYTDLDHIVPWPRVPPA